MNSTVLPASVQPNIDCNYIGLDVHSDNVVVCVRRNILKVGGELQGKTIKLKKVSICDSQDSLTQLLSEYADGQQHVMTAESTFNWYWLADIAEEHGWNFRLADPCTVSQANIKAANDETDAQYLAERLRMGSLKSTTVLPRALRGARDLTRHRMRVMQEVSEKKIRLSNLYHNHCAHPLHGKQLQDLQFAYEENGIDAVLASGISGNGSELIIADLLAGLHDAQMRLERIEAQVYERLDQIDTYREGRLLLKNSMKGCGDVLSAVIITEIGDISRFRTMGEFVSYCRLAPASKLSNGKSKGQGNAKNGNAYLSWALTELATLMARYNKSIQHYLERKVKKTGLRVIGIRALAAKLARCVYQVLRKKEAFDLLLAFGGSHPKEPSASRAKTEESSQRKTATKSSETKVTGMTRTVVTDKKKIPGKKPALAVTQTQRLKSAVGQKTASVASRLKAPCALTTTKPAYADRGCVKSRRE